MPTPGRRADADYERRAWTVAGIVLVAAAGAVVAAGLAAAAVVRAAVTQAEWG
jgi:hypothetical protein